MLLKAKTNPQKFNTTSRKLAKLEKWCSALYTNILSGQLFEIYLNGVKDQIRNESADFVFKNKTFKEKYLQYIKWKIENTEIKLGNPGDMQAAHGYMNLLINYALYRALFQDEDSKLYKKIWAL